MKAIGIVLLVLAGVILAIGVFSAVDEARGSDLRTLRLSLQNRLSMFLTPGVTWAGLGVCCLGLDALLKKKGQAAGSASASAAAPARAPKAAAPKAAAPKAEAPVRQAKPATAPAQGASAQAAPTATPDQPAAATPKPTPPVKPARPAIRPAGDDPPKRNEQDTPGQ